jgi:hypothetical protein
MNPFEGLAYQARAIREQRSSETEFAVQGEPPADRIAAYLADLAIRSPGIGVTYAKIAQVVFCLPRHRTPRMVYVAAVRQELPNVERRLAKQYGRHLLRLGKEIRASVSDSDARAVLAPRRRERAKRSVTTAVASLRNVEPQDIHDPRLREAHFEQIQYIHDQAIEFLSPEDQEWVRKTLERRASFAMS